MDSERWRRVEEVHNDVLAHPPRQCQAVLDEALKTLGQMDERQGRLVEVRFSAA